MSAQVRQLRRRAAKAPAPRTVDVVIRDGDFAGWECTARASFPARVLEDLESGQPSRITAALDQLIRPGSHNFPDSSGEIAERMSDVDPFEGLVAVLGAILDAIKALPPR